MLWESSDHSCKNSSKQKKGAGSRKIARRRFKHRFHIENRSYRNVYIRQVIQRQVDEAILRTPLQHPFHHMFSFMTQCIAK